jgi:hypothetical protein
LAVQIADLEQELADVTRAAELIQVDQTPAEDDAALTVKRAERSGLMAEQNRIADEITALEAGVSEIERTIMEIEREKVAIQEQAEVEYLINSLAVVRCPHCESAVDHHERLDKERAEHTCYVCSQPIRQARPKGDLKFILKARDDEITSLKRDVKRIRDEIAARQGAFEGSREAAARLGRDLEASVQQARQGFTVSYANLLLRKGQAEGQLAALRRAQAEAEGEQAEVEAAARWGAVLGTAAQLADESVYSIYHHAFSELCGLVLTLARAFGVPDIDQVMIDERRYVKVLQGDLWITHNELARSERVKFKVAFHVALMLIQVRSGVGKHPGFLIIDTPGTAEVDPPDLAAMLRDLVRIHAEYGEKAQILVATAREDALAHLPPGVVERPGAGGFF